MVKITKGSNKKLNPWEAKSLISLHKAWQIERSDKHCVPMTESHSTVLQKVSAPNAWVPLLLCPKVQCSKKSVPQMPGCPYCCAPKYSAPTVVLQMQCTSFRLPAKLPLFKRMISIARKYRDFRWLSTYSRNNRVKPVKKIWYDQWDNIPFYCVSKWMSKRELFEAIHLNYFVGYHDNSSTCVLVSCRQIQWHIFHMLRAWWFWYTALHWFQSPFSIPWSGEGDRQCKQ